MPQTQLNPSMGIQQAQNTSQISAHTKYPKSTHKICSHKHTRFKPYTTSRPPVLNPYSQQSSSVQSLVPSDNIINLDPPESLPPQPSITP
jgi:hypothetical protein